MLFAGVAKTPSAILIEGESGTGKELAARMLHQLSNRSGPFVPINCGAIAPELLEAELFGHTKGAFTGANKAREGLFNFASGGTLFLDEVGEMPLLMQAKLLRALEQKAVRPVGQRARNQRGCSYHSGYKQTLKRGSESKPFPRRSILSTQRSQHYTSTA